LIFPALDLEILSNMFRSGLTGQWECVVCGKTSKLKSDVARHVEGRERPKSKNSLNPDKFCFE
jgi:hypothetical protein